MSDNVSITTASSSTSSISTVSSIESSNVTINITQENLLQLLRCKSCLEVCTSIPIHQCKNGHIICDSCFMAAGVFFVYCDVCKSSLRKHVDGIRNTVAEQIAEHAIISCTFKKYGCDMTCKLKERWQHIADCPYRTNTLCQGIFGSVLDGGKCFFPNFKDKMIEHLKDHHHLIGELGRVIKINLKDIIMEPNSSNCTKSKWWSNATMYYLQFDEQIFILKCKFIPLVKEMSWYLLCLGSSVMAKKYRVKLSFQSGSFCDGEEEEGSKLSWEGKVVSIYESKKVKDSNQKFSLPVGTFETHRKLFKENDDAFWKLDVEIIHASSNDPPPPYDTLSPLPALD